MQGEARRTRSTLPATSSGSHLEAFGWTEWGLLTGIALIWGSSFLLIDVGLDAFNPGVVTMARVGLGALTLSMFRRARGPIDAADRRRVAGLGLIWIAIPLTLFPIAQQWIDSSVAGMLNGGMPIATAAWATVLLGRLPGWKQLVGIAIGFLGVVAIFFPEVRDSSASALGAALVVVAVILYGLSANLAVPLQQRYGALPVLFRAQLSALVVVVPLGLVQIPGSSWAWDSALAMVPLGALSTGLAFVLMSILVGRAGAPRGSIAIYFVPVVAIVLGVVVLGERVAPLALVGTALVVLGAWVTSRREDPVESVTVTNSGMG
jgi:drug/metabolite transporter (DMT)-like permease